MNVPFQKHLIAALFSTAFVLPAAQSAEPAKTGAMAPHGNSMAPHGNATAGQSIRDMRASKLIGSEVSNAQGENLGDIKDLIIDVTNDRVYYAILSFGGFMGLGDKLFAYPVSAFQQVGNEDKVILSVAKDRLKKAPGFDSKAYPDFNEPKYRNQVDGYFGPDASVKSMKNQSLRRASEWIGKNIDDRNGKDVGEVKDLVVNLGNGKIHYAVVEFDKAWSLNDKLLAVPMQALRYTSASKDLVWDIDKSRLDTKGAFDKNKWPDINDPKAKADIDRTLIVLVPVRSDNAAKGTAMPDKKHQ